MLASYVLQFCTTINDGHVYVQKAAVWTYINRTFAGVW